MSNRIGTLICMQLLIIDAPVTKLLVENTHPAIAGYPIRHPQISVEDIAFTFESINSRAKAVTPLLQELFLSRPPIRWGINE